MTGLELLFNILGFIALFYYVCLRIYKIKCDFTEGTPEWKYYVPTAIASVLVIVYGAGFGLGPVIATGCIEFLISFIMLTYFTLGHKCGCRPVSPV
jgi:hypothetical protein